MNSYLEVRPEGDTYYIFNGSQRIASVKDSTLTYYSQDHLGGTALATNSTGTVVEVDDYYPYGDSLASIHAGTTAPVHHTFTDKEFDDSLGLFYFEARWYNPTIGRFVSEDPMQYIYDPNGKTGVTSLLMDPQSFNLYSYSRDNPIVFVDPTGQLQVHTDGATEEQIDQFNDSLEQLQSDVANNQDIQNYFQLFGIDINETLSDPEKGPDVYLGGKSPDPRGAQNNAEYHWLLNDISVYNNAFEQDTQGLSATIIHEVGHWANDVSDWWGDLNPDLSDYSSALNHYTVNANFDSSGNIKRDGAYGYVPQYILYDK